MGQDQSKIHHDVQIRKVFNLYDIIGRGNYATVRRARRIDAKAGSEDFAIKVVKTAGLDDEEKRGLKEEIRLLLEINHPHIVKLHEVYVSRKIVYLVMELIKGGEMFDRIVEERFFSEAIAAYAIVQVLDALIYLHSMGICHRDLKPENLFYCTKEKKSKLVLGDFGLATQRKGLMKTCCGTPQYVAPEILNNTPYGCKVDCWSVGVVLYILLCGYPPFYADTHPRLYKMIISEPFEFDKEDWEHISNDAKDLITKLLVKDPSKRLSAREAKKHPWLTKAAGYHKALGAKYQDRMRRFTAVQKLRAGVTTMLAVIRMGNIMKDIVNDNAKRKVVTVKDNNKPKIQILDMRQVGRYGQ